jgi:hypothetical protein
MLFVDPKMTALGFEPRIPAYETGVLPLHYAVGFAHSSGIEPEISNAIKRYLSFRLEWTVRHVRCP